MKLLCYKNVINTHEILSYWILGKGLLLILELSFLWEKVEYDRVEIRFVGNW